MRYPLDLNFRIFGWGRQVAVRDADGALQLYVKQKSFTLKEDVVIYADEAMQEPLYRIRADRVIDFSANFSITDTAGRTLGALSRRGMKSLWRVEYLVRREGQPVFEIREDNPWVRVADAVLREVPLLGILSAYLFHPAYSVMRAGYGIRALQVRKQASLYQGRFRIESDGTVEGDDERLALLSVLLLVLLERRRG